MVVGAAADPPAHEAADGDLTLQIDRDVRARRMPQGRASRTKGTRETVTGTSCTMRHLPVRRLAGIASMLWLPILHAQAFSDPSPHRVGSVRHGGARLHYLEWGAKGPMVVLLPGYSLTAHVFDEIGPALAGSYHVIALTPDRKSVV